MPPQKPSSVICSFHPCASDRKGRGSVDKHKTDSSPSDYVFMNYFMFSVNVKCFSWLYLKPSAPMRAALLGSIYLFAQVSVFPGALRGLSGSWGSAQSLLSFQLDFGSAGSRQGLLHEEWEHSSCFRTQLQPYFWRGCLAGAPNLADFPDIIDIFFPSPIHVE